MYDKYKRNYRFKSNQSGSNKVFWISMVIALIIVALLYYFF
ncbi:hypothetical protein [Pedobacter endophyticus]|nr:hypothetical protein [Pedobacter endophyticus]